MAHTDGVTILPRPPTTDGAYISIASPYPTAYPSRRGYVPTSAVTIRWDGFAELANTPLQYEVRVLEGGATNWTTLGFTKMLSLSEIDLRENTSHMIQIRAVNLGGVASNSVGASFFIVSFPPQDTGMCECVRMACNGVAYMLRDMIGVLLCEIQTPLRCFH